jgi:hypothetical protein
VVGGLGECHRGGRGGTDLDDQVPASVLQEPDKVSGAVEQAGAVLQVTPCRVWRLLAGWRRQGPAGVPHGDRGRRPPRSGPERAVQTPQWLRTELVQRNDQHAYGARRATPVEATLNLVPDVGQLDPSVRASKSLDSRLHAAAAALSGTGTYNDVAAINSPGAFVNATNAQRGRRISSAGADEPIAAVRATMATI